MEKGETEIKITTANIYFILDFVKGVPKNNIPSVLPIRDDQRSITTNSQLLNNYIYHVMIIVTGGFSKKSFFINIIFIS